MFSYEYPHPAVTTDAAVFTIRDGLLQVLLIRRGREPFRGRWAFPGGFVDIDEELHDCAARELREEAGLASVPLRQLVTIGTVGRDPRERVITVVYWCLTAQDDPHIEAGDDADDAAWFAIANVPPLANDHDAILQIALRRLETDIFTTALLADLLPASFDRDSLHQCCETLLRRPCDPAMPVDRLLAMGLIERVGTHYRFAPASPAPD
jgi:8-oxo-dGTP diphosphatase